jgi:hypothetical protein
LEPRLLLSADPFSYAAAADTGFDLSLRLIDELGGPTIQLVEHLESGGSTVVAAKLLSATSEVIVTGSDADDRFSIEFETGSALEGLAISFDGGAGSDTLLGAGPDSIWNITGSNLGDVGSVTFSNTEILTGAADNEDTFIFSVGASLDGLVDGGDRGFDTLVIDGGEYNSVVSTATGPDSGFIDLDGNVIAYVGLEPVTLSDNIVVADLTIDLTSILSTTATLLDTGGADGMMTITADDTVAAFETVNFNNPTNSLTIDLSGPPLGLQLGNTLVIQSLDAGFAGDLIVNDGGGPDTVEITGDVILPGRDIIIEADTISVTGAEVSTSDTVSAGDITFTGRHITLTNAALLAEGTGAGASDGAITLDAFQRGGTDEIDILLADVDITDVDITLTNATVRGGDVTLRATGDHSHVLDVDDFGDTLIDETIQFLAQIAIELGHISVLKPTKTVIAGHDPAIQNPLKLSTNLDPRNKSYEIHTSRGSEVGRGVRRTPFVHLRCRPGTCSRDPFAFGRGDIPRGWLPRQARERADTGCQPVGSARPRATTSSETAPMTYRTDRAMGPGIKSRDDSGAWLRAMCEYGREHVRG